ncbi:copper amine oxidase N-terminal domain-containing protein [Paenibacillus sp. CN-4]|uniref:copper amine oxidase N-terminal domain-containing protein n=1 Tax=Paenibacillus nanchangensis TaxID=3348343 RepID=UPI00397C6FA1
MKYFLKVLVFAAAISVMGGNSSFASRVHPAIYINNEKLELSASVTWLGTTLVPMRPIFEQYGMSVTWDNVNKSVTATKDGITIKLTHNSNDAYVNGEKKVLTQDSCICEGSHANKNRAVLQSVLTHFAGSSDVLLLSGLILSYTAGHTAELYKLSLRRTAPAPRGCRKTAADSRPDYA